MKIKFILLSCAVLGALAGFWIAGDQRMARRAAERLVETQRRDQSQISREIDETEKRLAAIESERGRVTAGLDSARPKRSIPRGDPPAPSQNAAQIEAAASIQALRSDPRAQNEYIALARLRVAADFAELGEELKLTEAQTAQLVENLVKRDEEGLDLGFAIEKHAAGSNNEAVVRSSREQLDAELRNAQLDLLGEANFERYEAYRRTLAVRRFVDELAGRAVLAGIPIAATQSEALVRALSEASPPFRAGRAANPRAVEWDKALLEAERILDQRQLTAFRSRVIPIRNRERLQALAAGQ